VFGPVPSRRLGQSLGIDTVPLKTCNWNCVYCQLGRSVPMIHERREYLPRDQIISQAKDALAAQSPEAIDWITFVASGETTLHVGLGWMIEQVKAVTHIPVAVITNGSLLYLPEMRDELKLADAVLPTLDAGEAQLYRRINRPHPIASFDRLVQGLIEFRAVYTGELWIEVMLVRDLNDDEESLKRIASQLARIEPDEVHINLPQRPPVERWVKPPDEAGLERAIAILGATSRVVPAPEGSFGLSGCDDLVDAIVAVITRHPMREEELERTLDRWSPGKAAQLLAELQASGRAQIVERHGSRFWSASQAHFPDYVPKPKK
jgi:wyosine [tRNA(Phe)-imidazoG37] synthetase (radical SAM superfamily)